MIQRYEISAYCHRCGSAEGSNAVVVNYDEDKNGDWVRYFEYEAERSAMSEANSNAVLAEVRAVLKELNSIGPRINAHWCFGECSAGEEFCPREYCLDEKISELYKKVSEHCI